jgi:hypothetical protein
MSDHVEMYIEGQRAVIRQLRARGLPTYMATGLLEKLISERDAAAVEVRLRLFAGALRKLN